MDQPISMHDLQAMLTAAGVYDVDVVASDDVTVDGSRFLVRGKPRKACIVLLQFPHQDVGHFVCLWRRKGQWMYYDPTGKPMGHYRVLPPLEGVSSSPMVHQKRYVVHTDGAGARVGDMNTCGRHCIVRMQQRALTHAQYDNLLGTRPFRSADEYVNAATQ